MCAIAGVIRLELDEATGKAMLASMTRRGPDGEGRYHHGDCTLLHARLAIIDPLGGSQPMELDWAGEHYALVYNGELYNTEELRNCLLLAGHTFRGHSDTEVLLHAYAEFGEKVLEKFNGIFAIAVWEQKRGRLFLARDRIGVKPLFYMPHRGGLLFASEIKTILAYPTVRAELTQEGAAQILMLGPGRLPGSGVFRDISEIEPGCSAVYEGGRLSVRRYWMLRDGAHTDTFPQTAERVRALVLDAIRRQMVSDGRRGSCVAGGLVSSLSSAVCAGEAAREGKPLKTFSVDYRDNSRYFVPGKFQPNSDSDYIHIMVDALHTEHRWTVLTPEDLVGALEDATMARDLPGMADVDFSLLAFCREIRRDVKVALSGECADEFFGGYPWDRDPEVRARAGFPWAQNTAQRAEMMHPDIRVDGQAFVMDAYRKTCRESDILPDASPTEKRMKEMMNLNFRYFMQTLLDRKDRMSMYCGLEVRVPFCDYRIAEYLYRVPWEYKDYQGKEKGLLRYAMADILPEAVLWRKKSPYPKTFDPAYGKIVGQRLRALLADASAPLFALVRRESVEALFHADPKWPWYGQLMGVPQTMAYLLQIDFWLRHYQVSLCF